MGKFESSSLTSGTSVLQRVKALKLKKEYDEDTESERIQGQRTQCL